MTGRNRDKALDRIKRTVGFRTELMSETRLKRLKLKKAAARTSMKTEVATTVDSWLLSK
jgi:hypothetical protein